MSAVATAVVGGAVVGGYLAKEGAEDAAETQAAAGRDAMQIEREMFDLSRQDSREMFDLSRKDRREMFDLGRADSRRMFDLARGDRMPFASFGQREGLGGLQRLLSGRFEGSPGYEFRRNEGMRGIGNVMSAMGMRNSGRTLKDLIRFGQGLASEEYGNEFARNFNLASMGSNAASGNANAAMNMGQTSANAAMAMGQGNANAAMALGQGNAAGALGMGNSLANLQTQIGNANAAGQVGGANAWADAINSGFMNYGALRNR